jgi:hypothetical protein
MAMKASATSVTPVPAESSNPNAFEKFAANAREAVDADVIPEHMTANATMNVTK